MDKIGKDITIYILLFLDVRDLLKTRLIDKYFFMCSNDKNVWTRYYTFINIVSKMYDMNNDYFNESVFKFKKSGNFSIYYNDYHGYSVRDKLWKDVGSPSIYKSIDPSKYVTCIKYNKYTSDLKYKLQNLYKKYPNLIYVNLHSNNKLPPKTLLYLSKIKKLMFLNLHNTNITSALSNIELTTFLDLCPNLKEINISSNNTNTTTNTTNLTDSNIPVRIQIDGFYIDLLFRCYENILKYPEFYNIICVDCDKVSCVDPKYKIAKSININTNTNTNINTTDRKYKIQTIYRRCIHCIEATTYSHMITNTINARDYPNITSWEKVDYKINKIPNYKLLQRIKKFIKL